MTRQKTEISQQAAPIPKPIALIDTRNAVPYETLGIVVSIHDSMLATFKGNDAFQVRMRASGEGNHIITKIVTLEKPVAPGSTGSPGATGRPHRPHKP